MLVLRDVYGEGVWVARNGRVVMLARQRARVIVVDTRNSSAQRKIRQRQKKVHPVQPQQQRPISARREPKLIDPLAAGGTSIAGERQEQQ